jgi:hypothetical protein
MEMAEMLKLLLARLDEYTKANQEILAEMKAEREGPTKNNGRPKWTKCLPKWTERQVQK